MTARMRHVWAVSNSMLQAAVGVQETEPPDPPGTVAVHPVTALFPRRIWNSYEGETDESNFPVALLAVSTTVSGCWLLIGDTGVRAVTFSGEPAGAAPVDGSEALLGAAGVFGDLEQAIARAIRPAAAHKTNFLWCIKTYLGFGSG